MRWTDFVCITNLQINLKPVGVGVRIISQTSTPKPCKVPLYKTATLHWALLFFGHRPERFWNDRKKLSHFGQNVSKYRLKNTVMVSFNTTVRQMTEMFQWPKCLSKKDRNVSAKKKTDWASRWRSKLGLTL